MGTAWLGRLGRGKIKKKKKGKCGMKIVRFVCIMALPRSRGARIYIKGVGQ